MESVYPHNEDHFQTSETLEYYPELCKILKLNPE